MNIHSLFEQAKKEQKEKDKVKHTRGGTGEFYSGNQIHSSNFNTKIVPFTGKAYKLTDEDKRTKWQIMRYYLQEIYLYLMNLIKTLIDKLLAYIFNRK